MVEPHLQRPRLQRHAPVGDALGGQAEVPLAERGGAITLALAERGEREAVGFDMQRSVDGQHPAVLDRGAPIISARHQAVARRRADRAGRVGLGEAAAFLRQAIHIWRLHALGPVTAGTAPAVIIGQNDEDVEFRGWFSPKSRESDE